MSRGSAAHRCGWHPVDWELSVVTGEQGAMLSLGEQDWSRGSEQADVLDRLLIGLFESLTAKDFKINMLCK